MEARMEIGSFIELEFQKGMEYYSGDSIARLNCARAGVYHALRVMNIDTIHLPYYQCDTVRGFLNKKNIKIKYYYLNEEYEPISIETNENEAVLLVNYYGIMSEARMMRLKEQYKNVIIDNSQAFFAKPIENALNIYSPRKFFGVPDGCYVIGKDAENYTDEYKIDCSTGTSGFLLERIEYGCEKSYNSRMLNEERIDKSDILKMSVLTGKILDGVNYEEVKQKRIENFSTARKLFDEINLIDIGKLYDETAVPMVYPLLIKSEDLLEKLQKNKIFQGHWWSYLLEEIPENTFEYFVSKYIIPITIDQRYGENELNLTKKLVKEHMSGKNEKNSYNR